MAVKANSIKLPFDSQCISMLINVEKENLVIDLYYNQRRNVRQIAQEARVSFRDISAIIKKKEAAEFNDVGSGNGIVVVDNQQQQQSDDSTNKSPICRYYI